MSSRVDLVMESRNHARFIVTLVAGGILVLALIGLYWGTLGNLINQLLRDNDASYGLLLPLVSAFIIYRKWPQIKSQSWTPSWLGLVVIAGGIFLLIMGELAAELYTTRVSFIVCLTGLVFLLGGKGLVRLLAFPLLLLFLMIPLPGLVALKLTFPLQLLSSRLAARMFQVLGYPVLLQGNVIDLGIRQLQVVEACSGLRYIFGVLALGISYCYFFQRRAWKVAVLLIALIPIAIFLNAVRITLMGIFPTLQKGFWHISLGWSIFVVFFDIITGINWTLNRIIRPAPVPAQAEPPQMAAKPSIKRTKPVMPYLIAGLALVIMAWPLVHRTSHATPVPLRQSFDHFPLALGSWHGKTIPVDPEIIKATQSSAHFNADYTNPTHGTVSLWIAYYESQKKAGGFVHSPAECLPGSGWHFLVSKIVYIAPGLPVRYVEAEKMGQRVLVYYWYMQRGRWIASEYVNKYYMALDGLIRRRTDGALVRLITPVGQNLKEAKERLETFAGLITPILPQFIPK